MLKRITIEVDSTEDNSRIEYFLKRFIEGHLKPFMVENFQKHKDAKILIEDVIMCPKCKENELIPLPVGKPVESYYCHFCNKAFKPELFKEVDNEKKG